MSGKSLAKKCKNERAVRINNIAANNKAMKKIGKADPPKNWNNFSKKRKAEQRVLQSIPKPTLVSTGVPREHRQLRKPKQ